MTAIALLTLFMTAPVFSDGAGLVVNPGFEDIAGDLPVRWNVFVMPREGAVGKLDRTALSGQYAVMLHTSLPYDKEPTNNWSQNIIAELGGKKLRLSGHIKTREATEAAIWVQCWRKRPLRLLKLVNTSADAPMYGTREWEEVTEDFTVPDNTDFLTVRCVLLGTGTAWFDDIDLVVAAKDEEKNTDEKKKEDVGTTAGSFRVKVIGPDGVEYPEITLDAPKKDTGKDDVVKLMKKLEAEVGRLGEANKALADALDEMRDNNKQLMDEVLSMRMELRKTQRRQARSVRPTPGGIALDPPKVSGLIIPHEGRKD